MNESLESLEQVQPLFTLCDDDKLSYNEYIRDIDENSAVINQQVEDCD